MTERSAPRPRQTDPATDEVLWQCATEPPGSSPLLREKRPGTYHCAGCGSPLFDADSKYDSGSGWPSFTAANAESVGLTVDRSMGMERVEVHCAKCGGHLGHVFDDGPAPAGQRWCINGLSLSFRSRNE